MIKECTKQRRIEEKTARMKRQSGRVRMWRMRRFSVPSQPSWKDIGVIKNNQHIPYKMHVMCICLYHLHWGHYVQNLLYIICTNLDEGFDYFNVVFLHPPHHDLIQLQPHHV